MLPCILELSTAVLISLFSAFAVSRVPSCEVSCTIFLSLFENLPSFIV